MSVRGRRMEPKKKMMIVGVGVLFLLIILFVILTIINKNQEEAPAEPIAVGDKILLADTTYEGMKVTDIQLSYLTQNNETLVTLEIQNSTSDAVENESLNAILKDGSGNELSRTTTFIKSLPAGESYRINVVLKGDLSNTKSVELKKI